MDKVNLFVSVVGLSERDANAFETLVLSSVPGIAAGSGAWDEGRDHAYGSTKEACDMALSRVSELRAVFGRNPSAFREFPEMAAL